MDPLKYPIGYPSYPEVIDEQVIKDWINQIAQFPGDLRTQTVNVTEDQLMQSYREGGWNIRQLICHIGDSHLNSYIRFKWALTEDKPTIKAYDEKDWALLVDSQIGPIDMAVDFIEVLHRKWVFLLENLTEAQWDRSFVHPETGREVVLRKNLGLYAWHGQHHLAHIRMAMKNPA